MDLSINEDFELELEHKDLRTINNREQFEQHLKLMVTGYFHQLLGENNNSNTAAKLRHRARRVATDSEYVDSLEFIEVVEQSGDGIEIYMEYNSSESIDLEVI